MRSRAGTRAAPFPYFGGKSLACETVWAALGDPKNYVEPFAGSAAMLLGLQRAGLRYADPAEYSRFPRHRPKPEYPPVAVSRGRRRDARGTGR